MWYLNTLHFGIRGGGEEHRRLKWGDIELKRDTNSNLDYVEFNERQTKTRTGEDARNVRDSKPRAYETPANKSRCPVEIYKEYRNRRPRGFCNSTDPFYLAVVTNKENPRNDDQWFLRGPVGKNKINNILKNMIKIAKLPEHETKRLTNSSVRKHLCQKLMDKNVQDEHAIHITGHNNLSSLNKYRTLNENRKKEISQILSTTTDDYSVTQSLKNNGTFVGQTNSEPTLQHTSTMTSSLTNIPNSYPSDIFHAMFYGSTINGGTFNVNINFMSSSSPKRARQSWKWN